MGWRTLTAANGQGIATVKSGTDGRYSRPDALTHPKIAVSGHQRLTKPKITRQNRTQTVIHGQWAPAEILGPTHPQRSRFDKSSGIFLEGLSAAAWARRKRPKGEKPKELSVAAESEEEEEEVNLNFNGFDQEDADDGEDDEREEILPDFEALEMERLKAEEAERQAREKFEQAQEQVEAMTAEKVETTRKLVLLESLLQRAISDSGSSDEDEDTDEEKEKDAVGEEQGGRDGSMPSPSVPRSPDKVSKKKTKHERESSRFNTQQMAAQKVMDQVLTGDVKRKFKDGGINKEEYARLLSEQQIIGGAISLQDVHEAFDRSKRPTDQLMCVRPVLMNCVCSLCMRTPFHAVFLALAGYVAQPCQIWFAD